MNEKNFKSKIKKNIFKELSAVRIGLRPNNEPLTWVQFWSELKYALFKKTSKKSGLG